MLYERSSPDWITGCNVTKSSEVVQGTEAKAHGTAKRLARLGAEVINVDGQLKKYWNSDERTVISGDFAFVVVNIDNKIISIQLCIKDVDTLWQTRSPWKEAAAADLHQGDLAAASASFDAALKKDRNNQMGRFLKAQLDSRTGAAPEAARALEEIVKERPTKQLDAGLTLTAAAESALANLALPSVDLDSAIARFEELKRGGVLSGIDCWHFVPACAAKGDWEGDQSISLEDHPILPPEPGRTSEIADYKRHRDLSTTPIAFTPNALAARVLSTTASVAPPSITAVVTGDPPIVPATLAPFARSPGGNRVLLTTNQGR
jgi:hypothetical protein